MVNGRLAFDKSLEVLGFDWKYTAGNGLQILGDTFDIVLFC